MKDIPQKTKNLLRLISVMDRAVPELYNQSISGKPECGTPGCMLGWMKALDEDLYYTIIKGYDMCTLGISGDNHIFSSRPKWAEGDENPTLDSCKTFLKKELNKQFMEVND